jgi:ATP-dependent Clp protease ATP-binding subunit ClpA
MDTKQASRKAVAWLAIVFVLGIAIGVLGTYVVTTRVFAFAAADHNPATQRAHYIDRLDHELNLTGDQQKQIDAILSSVQANYNAIHESVEPQFDQARQSGRAQIRQILSPDQQPKFDDFMKRMDDERKAREAAAGGH